MEVQSLLKALGEGLQSKKTVSVTFFRPSLGGHVRADFALGPEDLGTTPVEPHSANSPADSQSRPVAVDKANVSYDGKNFTQWRTVWDQSDADLNRKLSALSALQAFADAGLQNEANSAIKYGLYSDLPLVAQRTRQYLKGLSKSDAAPIVNSLLVALKSDLSAERRIRAIRGLAAIGPNAESAVPELEKSLAKKNRREQIAAAAAIMNVAGKDKYPEELKITVELTSDDKSAAPTRVDNAKADAFSKFNKDAIKEQELLFPPDVSKARK